MTRHLAAAVLAATLLGALAGCANGSGQPRSSTPVVATSPAVPLSPPAASGTPASQASPPAVRPASSAPIPPPQTATATGPELTLSGRVEQGVEPGCLILRSGGGTYELMARDQGVVRAGATVVVTGHVVTGIMSHCMQGRPFQVTSARRG